MGDEGEERPSRRIQVACDLEDPVALAVLERLEASLDGSGHVVRWPYRGALRPRADVVAARMASAAVVVLLLGPRWRVAFADPASDLRTDLIEAVRGHHDGAFRLVPVLAGGAPAPTAGELPAGLDDLATEPMLAVRSSVEDVGELARLVSTIELPIPPRVAPDRWGAAPPVPGPVGVDPAAPREVPGDHRFVDRALALEHRVRRLARRRRGGGPSVGGDATR